MTDMAGLADVALDDPAAQGTFTTWATAADGRRLARSHLRLSGLWCAGCANVIETALRRDAGVCEAAVQQATRRALVVWDPARTRLSALLGAVRSAGYDAVPDGAASARALRVAEERAALWRLFVAAFCMMQVMMVAAPAYFAEPGSIAPDHARLLLWASWLLSIPVIVFSAAPMFGAAWRGLRERRIGMDLPVALGVGVTFIASSAAAFDPAGPFGREAYFDSLTMFVSFLLAGRYLALRLQGRVADALEGAIGRLPTAVWRVADDGTTTRVALAELRCGDRVRVPVGEAFPADGAVLEGCTAVDEALLTGESRPVEKRPGDDAIAGSLNLRAAVLQRVDRLGPETRYEGIVALLRTALARRPPTLQVADRVAAPFLAGVLVLAAAAAAVWSIVDPTRAVWVAVSVLIVTCPCALSLAAPVAYLAAAAALVRRGVLVQRLEALEALAALDTVCFDKTGTLTEGHEGVACAVEPAAQRAGFDALRLQSMAAALAASSSHPLSVALAAQVGAPGVAAYRWREIRELAGFGLEAIGEDGARHRLGSWRWATEAEVPASTADPSAPTAGPATADGSRDEGTGVQPSIEARVWFAGPGGLLAVFSVAEAMRADATATVDALRRDGLALALLSGDDAGRVRRLADRLSIDVAQGGATPADKLAFVEALQRRGHRVGMVGDGLNDAPVMAAADASFAIGEGAALTRAKADFVLMSGRLDDIAWARGIAQRALRVVRQNLAWAVAYNAACVPLALMGWFPPWAAGLGMAASSLVVVLNAARIDRTASRPAMATETS
ncbi:MAG: cation-translocating P-type ATPase [Caldimonas sp.]